MTSRTRFNKVRCVFQILNIFTYYIMVATNINKKATEINYKLTLYDYLDTIT